MAFQLFEDFIHVCSQAEKRWPADNGATLHFPGFWNIGLAYVYAVPRFGDYFCTPINSKEFAGTGGGGTHFSFLTNDGEFDDTSPVIVTTPDGAGNDFIGASLYEFLCLGCVHGFDMLEGICQSHIQHEYLMEAHPWERFRDQSDADHYQVQQDMLAYLRQELDLKPWAPDVARFSRLNETYRHRIRFNAEQREIPGEDEYEYPPFIFEG